MSKTHDLKCWPEYFQAIKRGEKTFEIRVDDRDFHPGDTLRLAEFDIVTGQYSGEEIAVLVTYKMNGGKWGVPENYCVLGIQSPTMAAEIKRLEAENESLSASVCTLAGTCSGLRARIALLESALGLPDGCDVFQIERAEKEDVKDGEGNIWRFHSKSDNLRFVRFTQKDSGLMVSVNKKGEATFLRLYCIKEANK